MQNTSMISVIIPVYNVEQYLVQCLESVMNQTYPNLEIICINDASTDGSLDILRRLEKKDQRVRVIDKINEGVSRARNVGLEIANGKYIMFVDADDWIDVDTCEKAIQSIEDNEADVVMWSYVSEYGTLKSFKKLFADNFIFERQDVLKKLHRRFVGIVGQELEHPELADSISPVWGKLYRKTLIQQSAASFVDLTDIGTYEDGLFNLEVFFYAKRVVYLNQCMYHYRKTNRESLTKTYNEKLFVCWQNLFDYISEYIRDNDLPIEYREALDNRIALSVLGLGLNIVGSDYSMRKKLMLLRDILMNDRYIVAYSTLDCSHFPIHWKIFYGFATHKFAFGMYVLLLVIRRIICG